MMWPDNKLEVEVYVELDVAKAALVGIKQVISGVVSRAVVRFTDAPSVAKVVWLSAIAVSEISSGRVK